MEDENEISDQNSIISSYYIGSLSDISDENEEKECSYSSSSSDNNNSNDKEHKLNSYTISPKLKEILVAWIEDRKILLEGKEVDALFISNQKKRINQETVRLIIRKYSEKAIGQKVSPHRLRAAYGNIIYKETHDIELTSRAMKHSNLSTTRLYMEDDEELVNNRVADILGSIF